MYNNMYNNMENSTQYRAYTRVQVWKLLHSLPTRACTMRFFVTNQEYFNNHDIRPLPLPLLSDNRLFMICL